LYQLERNAPFLLFLCTLCFAPFALSPGATEVAFTAIVELLICTTAIFYFFQIRKIPRAVLDIPGMLPLGLLIVWMCLQLIPLPPALVQIIAPASYQVYEPILSIADSSPWIPLTVSQKAGSLEVLRISSYILFYVLTVQLLSSRALLVKTVQCAVLLVVFISLWTIFQEVTASSDNHYAGLLEMLCPLVLALFFFYRPTINYDETLRARITAIFTMPSSNLHCYYAIGVIIIVSSVFFSMSPGSVMSMGLAFLLFFFLQARKKIDAVMLIVAVFCTLVLTLSLFGRDLLFNNFNKIFFEIGGIHNARIMLWQDTWKMMLDFLITGSGMGTFMDVYPQYRTLPGTLVVDHAYNEYIEIFTDGGLIGFYLTAWFVLVVLVHGWKRIGQRRDRYAILVTIGALTGIVSILLRSMTNCTFHLGANGLYFFFTCGLIVSAGNARLYYRTRPTFLKQAVSNRNYLFPVTGLLLLFGVGVLHGGGFMAVHSYSDISSIYLNKHLAPDKMGQVYTAVAKSRNYDSLEGFYPSLLGNMEYYQQHPDEVLQQYSKAVRLDPLNGEYLQNLGLFLAPSFPEQADMLLAKGYDRAIYKERYILTWAEWLLRFGRRQKAVAVMQKGAQHSPEIVPSLTPFFMTYSLSREEISAILPESTASWMYLGSFMEETGKLNEVEYYFSHALKYLDREKRITPWYFDQVYSFYCQHNQEDKAVSILRQAVKRLPNHAPFHAYLGDYYKKEGINYRAREEYEQASFLEPNNVNVRRKLLSLGNAPIVPQ
jgi:Tfp pilus assembly protein PilF/O-antigen ligase